MRQVVVELDDDEMVRLEAIARERHVELAEVLKVEALKGLSIKGLADIAEPVSNDPAAEAKERRRQTRLAILMRSSGIFAGDKDKPKDGLIYQKELRAEWL